MAPGLGASGESGGEPEPAPQQALQRPLAEPELVADLRYAEHARVRLVRPWLRLQALHLDPGHRTLMPAHTAGTASKKNAPVRNDTLDRPRPLQG